MTDLREHCKEKSGTGVTDPARGIPVVMDSVIPSWTRLSVDDLAAAERFSGARVVKAGGRWWRTVRACFYRPLYPFEEIPPGSPYPMASMIGGAQHLVSDRTRSNSHMHFLLSEQALSYSRDTLGRTFRYQLHKAESAFEVRPIPSAHYLAAHGHAVYVSFFKRTGYHYRADRIEYAKFRSWADRTFDLPVLVLGAFRSDEPNSARRDQLVAVSLSYLVVDTVYYATFFASDEAQQQHVGDLMLHTVRQAAAASRNANRVYAGMATGRTLDKFYLLRGMKLASLPALFTGNPVSLYLLKRFAKGSYERLLGMDIMANSPAYSPPETSS